MRLARKVSPFSGRLRMATEPDALAQRVAELDTIAAVLPMERRDELAELWTGQDVGDAGVTWSTREWGLIRCGHSPLILPIYRPGRWLRPAARSLGPRLKHCFSCPLRTTFGMRKSV